MLQVRDAVREVFRTQLADASDEAIVEARRHLNRTYDSFVCPLRAAQREGERQGVRRRSGPAPPAVARRIRPGDEAGDQDGDLRAPHAGALSPGRASRDRLRGAAGVAQRDRRDQLAAHGVAHREAALPSCRTNLALSSIAIQRAELGRPPTGISAATCAQSLPSRRPRRRSIRPIDRNVEALRAVQPKDLEPGEIEARLGSSWIPPSDVRDFVAELLDVPRASVKIGYAETIATWTVELDYGAKHVVNNTTTHGTARFRASELIEQSLNGRTPTAYDEHAGWEPHRQSAGNDCRAREAAAVEGSLSRMGLGRSRARRRGWRESTTSASTTSGSAISTVRI